MGGERREGASLAAGILHHPIRRVAVAVRVGPKVDDRFGKIRRGRWEGGVVVIVAVSDRDETGVEQFVRAGIIVGKLLWIVGAPDPPGKAKMQSRAQPIE